MTLALQGLCFAVPRPRGGDQDGPLAHATPSSQAGSNITWTPMTKTIGDDLGVADGGDMENSRREVLTLQLI